RIAPEPALAEDLARLTSAFTSRNTEVRADDVERPATERGARPDRTARLDVGEVGREGRHLFELERKAAQERVAVVARAPSKRPTKEERHPQARREIARVVDAVVEIGRRRVELLERDQVGVRVGAEARDRADRVAAVRPDAAVDVVRHEAEARA